MKITLTDGRSVWVSNISLLENRFYYFGEDITGLIRRADKNSYFPEFNPVAENFTSAVHSTNQSATPLSTNTAGFFAEQIIDDPLDAPLESLANQTKKIFGNIGVQIFLGIGLIALFVWMGGGSRIKGILKK